MSIGTFVDRRMGDTEPIPALLPDFDPTTFEAAGDTFGTNAQTIHDIGPDVSHYQGRPQWGLLLPDPAVQFAFCKATQGSGYTDTQVGYNLAAFASAADAGDIAWYGGYHWLEHGNAAGQVAHFVNVCRPFIGDPHFRAVLDWEGGFAADADAWAAALDQHVPLLRQVNYGGAYVRFVAGDPLPSQVPHIAAGGGFIVAKYGEPPPTPPRYTRGTYTFQQYTNGVYGPADQTQYPRSIHGFHSDISAFHGDHAAFAAWVAKTGGHIPPPPPPPPPPGTSRRRSLVML